jgi:uncharacterized protein (TIGR02594 family)
MTPIPQRFAHLKPAPKPAWMMKALDELGQREVAGAASNPRIIQYRKMGKTPLGGDDGKVPWCAIFTNAMLETVGVSGSGSAMARSYVSSKEFRRLDRPMLGCVAVKSSNRGPASGHVGFYVGEDGLFIYLVGGNQNDEVNISPFRKKEFVGFYWPRGQPEPVAPWNGPYRLPRPSLPHEKRAAAPPPTREA